MLSASGRTGATLAMTVCGVGGGRVPPGAGQADRRTSAALQLALAGRKKGRINASPTRDGGAWNDRWGDDVG